MDRILILSRIEDILEYKFYEIISEQIDLYIRSTKVFDEDFNQSVLKESEYLNYTLEAVKQLEKEIESIQNEEKINKLESKIYSVVSDYLERSAC